MPFRRGWVADIGAPLCASSAVADSGAPPFHTFPPSLESAVAMWCKKIYIAAVLAGSASAFVSSRPTSDKVP